MRMGKQRAHGGSLSQPGLCILDGTPNRQLQRCSAPICIVRTMYAQSQLSFVLLRYCQMVPRASALFRPDPARNHWQSVAAHCAIGRFILSLASYVLNDSGGPPFHSPIYPPDDTMNRETVQFINSLSATVASQGSPPHTHSHDPLGPVHSHDHGGEHGHTHEHLDNPGSSLNPLVRDRQ